MSPPCRGAWVYGPRGRTSAAWSASRRCCRYVAARRADGPGTGHSKTTGHSRQSGSSHRRRAPTPGRSDAPCRRWQGADHHTVVQTRHPFVSRNPSLCGLFYTICEQRKSCHYFPLCTFYAVVYNMVDTTTAGCCRTVPVRCRMGGAPVRGLVATTEAHVVPHLV